MTQDNLEVPADWHELTVRPQCIIGAIHYPC